MNDDARAAQRWAASGAMALTGRSGGPPLGGPATVIEVLDDAAARLQRVGGISLDGPALLGERAAIAGLSRRGEMSCGGGARLLQAADGWVAVSLPRADDIELLPAWLGVDAVDDPWPALRLAVRARLSAETVAAGAELGLAVSRLGECTDRRAVLATPLAAIDPLPAQGMRVIDLSSLWAGPLCGQLLALAGLDVVKVESSRRPDGARRGPAAFYDLLNAGKASVSLDFTSAPDRAALRQLVRSADVVIEASRPRALQQIGIDAAASLAAGNVRVWLSITAHGREHPERTGFGDDAAVAGGLIASDSRGPVFLGDATSDPATGLLAAVAVLERLTTGGRWLLDVALARTAAALAAGPVVGLGRPISPPRARPISGAAAPLGRDNDRILGTLARR